MDTIGIIIESIKAWGTLVLSMAIIFVIVSLLKHFSKKGK